MFVRLRRITPIVYVGIFQHRRFVGFPLASGAIGLFTGEEGIDENDCLPGLNLPAI